MSERVANNMRIVYMGTPEFAVKPLAKLISHHEVALVVTKPDAAAGRGKKVISSPVKLFAQENHLRVITPLKFNEEVYREILAVKPEVIVVAAYGKLLPREILNIPPYGCLNIHASLLPFYRGAAPIERCLMAGEKETGITIMYMDEGLDTGDIALQEKVAINQEITGGELREILAEIGADLIIEALKRLREGGLPRVPQDHQLATYAPPLKKEDEIIHWADSAEKIRNQIRALNPVPGAYTVFRGKKIKIWKAKVGEFSGKKPGEIIFADRKNGFLVATGERGLQILELQPEGGKKMSWESFLNGYRPLVGETFEC
ncbi:methionyl-tRNA formyltransferase [Carboxydothermus ferrireducens]|uniref:Methionyl-tRNA formyltransferase n=2 Tax=Carboxydothermus TaxID=129957 RepID=A0ABX2RCD0_9THEO|nr:methionyl-tRNA formyltransferase [Carboxydothermus ferrireducens]NYE58252.1 methionyl-tRNA formyltransferase [Carboxydothermus ferrireducens DSM 11255]